MFEVIETTGSMSKTDPRIRAIEGEMIRSHALCLKISSKKPTDADFKGLKLSISLREDTEKEMIWVSLRSVDNFPCNEVAARFFNGGGHLNASGGKLACTMAEAVDIVKQAFVAFEDRLK